MAEIGRHPRHVARAQRLHAGILNGIERRTGDCLGWPQRGMARDVVVLELQRKTVGKPTRFGDLLRRQQTSRHRNLEILASLAGRVGGESKFHLGLMRKRPRRSGQDRFKMFKGCLVGHMP